MTAARYMLRCLLGKCTAVFIDAELEPTSGASVALHKLRASQREDLNESIRFQLEDEAFNSLRLLGYLPNDNAFERLLNKERQ